MDRINGIKKLTDNRYLNLYELDATFRDGSRAPYYVASRRKSADLIKAASHDNHPDGVILCGVYGEEKDRLVLSRQYRYPIDGYVYEFPAGLVEPGEDMVQAGIREMKEETGLDIEVVGMAWHVEEVNEARGQRFVNYMVGKVKGGELGLGFDPELGEAQVLKDIKFLSKEEIAKLDHVYPKFFNDEIWEILAEGPNGMTYYKLRYQE